MKLLTTLKEKYLLEAGIDSLHQETNDWLSAINMWEDETRFYKDIIKNKLFIQINSTDRENIDGLLDSITASKLSAFEKEVLIHENFLRDQLKKNGNEGNYRARHKELWKTYAEIETIMHKIKSGVFELYKLVNMNFFTSSEVLDVIHERRSVRKYKSKSIDRVHIEQIIAAGRMAPSAMNKQPWKFYVLTDPEKLKLYSDEIKKVVESTLHLSLSALHKEKEPVFHNAPVAIFITAPRDNEWACLDIGMCVENIMLAARSLGYDTCPVGLAKAIEKTSVYKNLNIPSDEEIKLAVVLGYGDEKPVARERVSNNLVFLS